MRVESINELLTSIGRQQICQDKNIEAAAAAEEEEQMMFCSKKSIQDNSSQFFVLLLLSVQNNFQ